MNNALVVKQQGFFAKALSRMIHGSRPAFLAGLLRRTRFDYRREVEDGLDSSVVTAPIRWVQRALPEARLVINRRKGAVVEEVPDHPLIKLIKRPNPFYGDRVLWAATVLSWFIDGNAYWIKVRNRAGKVVELWWVPWWTMEPKAPQDGSEFLSHYEYRPGNGAIELLDPADVVHFRDGMNPRNMRKGLSALDGVIREIFIDLEASNFVASLLRNMGVPGVVISPKGGAMPAPDDVEATKSWFKEAFGGDNRGGPLVMGAPTDVQPYGFNPQQMNMSEGRDVAEERVCACIGIPAAVVGFGAGLQTAKVGATMEELSRQAWTNGVLPTCTSFADTIEQALLPDFGNTNNLEPAWNTDNVRALREDEDKETERWGKRLASGGITVAEYRRGLGMDADKSHNIYLRPIAQIEVPADGQRPVVQQLPKSGEKGQPDEEAIKRAEAWLLMLQRQERGLRSAFEKPLNGFFQRLGQAATEAARPMLSEPKKAETPIDEIVAAAFEKLGIDAWNNELTQIYGAHYLEVAKAVQDAAERAGLGANLPDPVARAIVAGGGRRVGLLDLDGQTREAIFEALAEGRAAGEGAQALADRIELYVEGGPWNTAEIRAKIIARAETKFAQNLSTIERAKAAGISKFIVFDGRFGLPRSTPSHIARNGSVVNAEEALTMAATEHPNGTLSLAPSF